MAFPLWWKGQHRTGSPKPLKTRASQAIEYLADFAYIISMETWFNFRKVAQVAAFFCQKEGGAIPVLKLVKLIYLSDRQFMSECGLPMTHDRHVSMPHGPVNSITYDLIGGSIESAEWTGVISAREGNTVALSRALTTDDTDELSDAEVDALEAVWGKFGGMSKFALRDWTHENCPEWEDPHGSSSAIPPERTLRFLGVENAERFAQRSEVYREFRSALSELQGSVADNAW